MSRSTSALAAVLSLALAAPAAAQTISNVQFQNGIAISGKAEDKSGDLSAFDRRVGFFSDIYYDRNTNEWWGLSDRGPGGGTLGYETRINRFTVDFDAQGKVSNYNVVQTIKFRDEGGNVLNGLSPGNAGNAGSLGRAFDPEGMVINPLNGNIIVSDEYGPSVIEFDRAGNLVKRYDVPANLVPRTSSGANYDATPSPTGASALKFGRENNRGLEGLAVSPDGKYVYAMLQNGRIEDGWSSAGGGTRGQFTRIIKYDVATGQAVGQYAYQLNSSGQGRGISAIVALGNDKFMILERNNRGIGVGATLASPDKKVFTIDLAGATDVTNMNLPALASGLGSIVPVAKNGTAVMDLAANTLPAIGNKVPEKWEGLAVGPQLANGKYLILAGTDNDYSVTQNGSNTQFDVYMNFSNADPMASSIQCPIGTTTGCFNTSNGLPANLTSAHDLLPGILHSYTADITGYVAPVPEPTTITLMAFGLAGLGVVTRRRRRNV